MLVGLGHYSKHLKEVVIRLSPKLTNAGFHKFSRLVPNLTHFSQTFTSINNIDDRSYDMLLQNCRNLTSLEIRASNQILYTISHYCQNLSKLVLDDESQFEPEAMQSLTQCTKLEQLEMPKNRSLLPRDIFMIMTSLPQLRRINLSSTMIDNEALLGIEEACLYLEDIDVSFTSVSGAGIEQFLRTPNKTITCRESQLA